MNAAYKIRDNEFSSPRTRIEKQGAVNHSTIAVFLPLHKLKEWEETPRMKEGNWEARHGKKESDSGKQMVVLLVSTANLKHLPHPMSRSSAFVQEERLAKVRDSGFQEELPARVYQTFNFQKALQRLNKKYHFLRVHDENCLSS